MYFTALDSHTRLKNFDTSNVNKEIADWLLAENVMSPTPVSVQADEKIEKAVEIFLENDHRSIVVSDGELCVRIATPLDLSSICITITGSGRLHLPIVLYYAYLSI